MSDQGHQNEQERAEEYGMPIQRDRLVGHEIEPKSRTEEEAASREGDDLETGGVERRSLSDEGAATSGDIPEHEGIDEDALQEDQLTEDEVKAEAKQRKEAAKEAKAAKKNAK